MRIPDEQRKLWWDECCLKEMKFKELKMIFQNDYDLTTEKQAVSDNILLTNILIYFLNQYKEMLIRYSNEENSKC